MSASPLFRHGSGFQLQALTSWLWSRPGCRGTFRHLRCVRSHHKTRTFLPRSCGLPQHGSHLLPARQDSTQVTDFHTCARRPHLSFRPPSSFSRNGTFVPRTVPCLTSKDVSFLVCRRQVSTEAAAVQVSTAAAQVSTAAAQVSTVSTAAAAQVPTEAGAAPATAGWYADMFGPESPPVQVAMTVLEQAHLHTGLPWWATIVMTTAVLRLGLTFPLAVYQAHVIARVERLQPELGRFAAALRRQVSIAGHQRGWTEKQMRRKFNVKMREFRTSLFIRDNCHPFKGTLLVWVQLPLFICVSFALRHLTGTFQGVQGAATLQPDMVSQGALWFTDLTAADPTLLLPALLGTLNLVIVEMHSLQQADKTRTQTVITNFFRGVSVVMVMVAAYMPAAMVLYWTSSSAVGLAQNILLKLPWLRQACGIPPTPRDSPTPFRDMAATLGQKLRGGKGKPAAKS